MAKRPVLQFKITLLDIMPKIWRRIQISDLCSFWDLHVAIQDAMGWQDYHLHQFQVTTPVIGVKEFMGIPDDEGFDDNNTLPGWEYKVKDYLESNKKMLYEYDFGDGWMHMIEYEGIFEKQPDQKYPVCLAGKRACPPEDVGGEPGYDRFLEIINNPKDEEHEDMLTWVGGRYDPDRFDPKKVKFDNPTKRWRRAFEDE